MLNWSKENYPCSDILYIALLFYIFYCNFIIKNINLINIFTEGRHFVGRVINVENQFNNKVRKFRKDMEEEKEFLSLCNCVNESDEYYLIKHEPLKEEDNFVNILCPNCGDFINEDTLHMKNIKIYGKKNSNESQNLKNRENWGIAVFECPVCHEKLAITFE